MNLSEHLIDFTPDEFACPCGCENITDAMFVKRLQAARTIADTFFIILSGHRCPDYNREVGGVEDSSHIKGLAVDIRCTSSTNRMTIEKALLLAGFNRIGIGENFIHVDMDTEKPQNIIWTYYE